VQITAIDRWDVSQATVHNLTVANTHTYYVVAADTPVLVHNCGLADAVAEHRANANGGLGVSAKKNIAAMEATIDGAAPRTTIATSGVHVNPGEVGMPATRLFTPPNPSRAFDSEVFLFEDLAQGLRPKSIGTINLYSELTVCPSCGGVIDQFRARFPGIRINIRTGED